MQATQFEFRYRFFIFTLIYSIGFALKWPGSHQTLAESLANLSGHPTRLGIQTFFAVGALIIVIAAALRTWATAYLQGEVVHDMAMHSDRLVADGPYRYVRNPLYLGTALLAAGIGFLSSVPSWIFLVSTTVLFNLRLIFREEAGLQAGHSQSYLAFKAAVPRFIPAFTPRLPGSGKQPHWRQAWFAESFMWAFALAMLVFAFTLNTPAFFGIMSANLFAYAILHIVNTHRQKQTQS